MTQHEKILLYLVEHPSTGITIRDGFRLGINWPHKRIRELEEMGVQIKRIDDENDGTRFRRYVLANKEKAEELIESYERKRA